jgi:hypothetical protein
MVVYNPYLKIKVVDMYFEKEKWRNIQKKNFE